MATVSNERMCFGNTVQSLLAVASGRVPFFIVGYFIIPKGRMLARQRRSSGRCWRWTSRQAGFGTGTA